MNNNMNELSDEQLAEIAGADGSLVSNVGNTELAIINNVQVNVAVAPTVGIALGSALNIAGAHIGLGNNGLLSALNKH
jgi:hypothetical protein